MGLIAQLFINLRGRHRRQHPGQTMTEYALIMAAVAVVVFITYQTMGGDIGTMVSKINTDLISGS